MSNAKFKYLTIVGKYSKWYLLLIENLFFLNIWYYFLITWDAIYLEILQCIVHGGYK